MVASFVWEMGLRHPIVTTGTTIRHLIICLWESKP
jgi:hypothetical protein